MTRPKYVVSGASGLVGSALCKALVAEGAAVVRLVRDRGTLQEGTAYWQPRDGEIDANALEGVTGVVHLAGENVSGGRWTTARKTAILDSRVNGTSLLARTVCSLEHKPQVFVSASAVGYYGSRGDEAVDETAAPGTGFLAKVCRRWEAEAEPIRDCGVRLVKARIGVVLDPHGGALEKMKRPFQWGLGGRVGDGRQYMSWISSVDLTRALQYVLHEASVAGPINMVAPQPVTNADFTAAMGRVLRRPTALPVPKFALRLGVGDMADEMLLSGARVTPTVLQQAGFKWQHPDIDTALRYALHR